MAHRDLRQRVGRHGDGKARALRRLGRRHQAAVVVKEVELDGALDGLRGKFGTAFVEDAVFGTDQQRGPGEAVEAHAADSPTAVVQHEVSAAGFGQPRDTRECEARTRGDLGRGAVAELPRHRCRVGRRRIGGEHEVGTDDRLARAGQVHHVRARLAAQGNVDLCRRLCSDEAMPDLGSVDHRAVLGGFAAYAYQRVAGASAELRRDEPRRRRAVGQDPAHRRVRAWTRGHLGEEAQRTVRPDRHGAVEVAFGRGDGDGFVAIVLRLAERLTHLHRRGGHRIGAPLHAQFALHAERVAQQHVAHAQDQIPHERRVARQVEQRLADGEPRPVRTVIARHDVGRGVGGRGIERELAHGEADRRAGDEEVRRHELDRPHRAGGRAGHQRVRKVDQDRPGPAPRTVGDAQDGVTHQPHFGRCRVGLQMGRRGARAGDLLRRLERRDDDADLLQEEVDLELRGLRLDVVDRRATGGRELESDAAVEAGPLDRPAADRVLDARVLHGRQQRAVVEGGTAGGRRGQVDRGKAFEEAAQPRGDGRLRARRYRQQIEDAGT